MTDKLARQTATNAHRRITETSRKVTKTNVELRGRITKLEKLLARRAGFVGRCSLCGDPCKPDRRYCHAHSWAEGT